MSHLIQSLLEPARRTARRFSSPQQPPIEEDVVPTLEDDLSTNVPQARSDAAETSDTTPTRDPAIARANGFQGLIPLDDIRSNYVFDDSPVLSPSELDDPAQESLSGPPLTTTGRLQDRTIDSIGAMSLDDAPATMSRNPSLTASDHLRLGPTTSSIHSGRSVTSGNSARRRHADIIEEVDAARVPTPIMSGHLPEDDGMRDLRRQLQQIREMALSTEEKAKAMHDLMTAEYKAYKALADDAEEEQMYSNGAQSPTSLGVQEDRVRSPSPGVLATAYNLQEVDLHPTYRPSTPSQAQEEVEELEDEPVLGCKHYMRNVKVQCNDCRKWYTCRHCHDEVEKHTLVRKDIKNMLCMLCSTPQPAAEYCRKCNELTAVYFCGICKLWDNDPRRRIYHCPDCGICRVGEGLGKDYVHCKRCNVCINIAAALTHRCVERATECDCPICGEWMFTSSASVVAIKCGHYIHRSCYDQYMQTSYKCPICNRSAVNMELQWRKLDRHIEMQPMPSQFTHTKVWIGCNDCAARSCTSYHWLGNKCTVCGSYNTNEIKIVDSPADQEARAVEDAQRVRMATQVVTLEQHANIGSPEPMAVVAPAEAGTRASSISTPPQQYYSGQPSYRTASDPYATLLGGDIIQSPDLLTPDNLHAPPPPATPPHSPPRGRRPTLSSSQQASRANTATIDYRSPGNYFNPGNSQPAIRPEEDDAAFWGERIISPIPTSLPTLPINWTLRRVSMPQLPTMTMPSLPAGYMPNMPNMANMPNMPTLPNMPSLPSMPTMRSMGMPSIPAGYMPTMQMQMPSMPNVRGLSPSGWSMRSMSIGSLPRGMRSPGLFARKPEQGESEDKKSPWNDEEQEDEDDDGEGDDEDEEDDSDDSDVEMNDGDEEDGDVDDWALFGHR